MENESKADKLLLPCGKTLCIVRDKALAAALSADGVIAVYDDRHTGNPSFQIQDSYRVVRFRERREILAALMLYNASYPTDPPWVRSLGSLERELAEHNFAWRVGFLLSRARSVDLDNHAEGRGAFGYFLKSAWGVLFRK